MIVFKVAINMFPFPWSSQMKNSTTRILRGCAAFLANVLAALIGVGMLKSLSSLLVKLFTHSRASIILTEWIGSIVFAALLGNSVQRRWRTRTARWIWMPAVLVFLFDLAGCFGFPPGNPWLTFSGIACAQAKGIGCIQFTVFTGASNCFIPLDRSRDGYLLILVGALASNYFQSPISTNGAQ